MFRTPSSSTGPYFFWGLMRVFRNLVRLQSNSLSKTFSKMKFVVCGGNSTELLFSVFVLASANLVPSVVTFPLVRSTPVLISRK